MTREPSVLLESFSGDRDGASWAFAGLVGEIAAHTPADVVPALHRVEAALAGGLHAAGFVSYEAASGLEQGLATRPAGDLPLLWFGLFRQRVPVTAGGPCAGAAGNVHASGEWRPSLERDAYAGPFHRIREHIAAGDTYQVNFSLRQRFNFDGAPFAWYRDLCRAQRAPFCAYLDLGRYRVLSASPELFFRLDNGRITVRPMKGTARRGRWCAEDDEARRRLKESEKERAENLMIVDLLRNDLGMVAETGSVEVLSLFDVETLPTVHQMTSTVTGRLREGIDLVSLFRALFPCGSVTGAPKRKTMEIIAALEDSPRGLYTGCIGYLSPGPEAVFSVAIRTAVIDSVAGRGELGIGSGITWDSRAAAEYDECLSKSSFARTPLPEFNLIESLLWEEADGYYLLDRHLARLTASAGYFGYPCDPPAVREQLAALATGLSGTSKVRLLLAGNGGLSLESSPVAADAPGEPMPVALAGTAVDSGNPFIYHKTDNRDLGRSELAGRPDCIDLLFVNERGELTEGTYHNLVLRLGGKLVTPPVASGLLPGVFREELLETGVISERVVTPGELAMAEEVWLVNSVRRWRRARLV